MSAILARRNGASPFDGSLRRAVSSLGLPELQVMKRRHQKLEGLLWIQSQDYTRFSF